ncbi:T9SS type A sorting domain-containing protein [Chryseobacterium sp. WG23]|uniref:T9SS type A sorting domain-containing protein n=1 Tax=Chryseobacterium sp. WG23 TaxID=2926910 RepID=UPI00211E43AC|nr:T9SS type A sorting domain-containing protein [Chryseobacterium sp. WG23]MCQ9635490.1 T9SS type A sorting domain-containing protein [Chryseobacterium sp. WG23]
MKKILLLLLVFFSSKFFTQQLSYATLPEPNALSLNYLNSLSGKNILYGTVPPNYNGKTILFTHGFVMSTESLLIGNSMYKEAYSAGYKTAFVATSRFLGDWENGEILSRAIDQVGVYLGANIMTIVAHSNGGKASDVALLEYQKTNKVDKVITLGTPHRGTQIADFANYPMWAWITGALQLGTGSQLSTTSYCDTYFRPYMDNHPLNQPKKHYSLGAWGYTRVTGLLSPAIIPAGTAIAALGGGKNDGVTPFYSSTRPGSKQLMTDTDPRGYINHIDIMEGVYVWDNAIKPVLDGQIVNNGLANKMSQPESSEFKVISNYQLISSNDMESLQLGKNANNVRFEVITKDVNASVDILDPATGKMLSQIKNNTIPDKSGGAESRLLSSGFNLRNKELKLSSNSKFVAVVEDGIDSPMEYRIKKDNEKTYLEVTFPNLSSEELQKVSLQNETYWISDLKGKNTGPKEKAVNVKFELRNNRLVADVSREQNGIYSIKLAASLGNGIRRNIINGFVVSNNKDVTQSEAVNVQKSTQFNIGDNPVNDNTKLISNGALTGEVSVKIYNYSSKLLNQYTVKVNGENSLDFGKHAKDLEKGTYIVYVEYGSIKESMKFIKR